MRRHRIVIALIAGLSLSVGAAIRADTATQIVYGYGHLPLCFEANTAPTDAPANFISRGQGYTLYLTPTEAVLALHKDTWQRPLAARVTPPEVEVVRMTLLRANPQAAPAATEQLPGTVNYLIGNDPARWRHTIPLYARATFARVYPGVDLTYYGTQGQLEYDFTVAPGTDPRVITLAFDDVRETRIDPNGELVLRTATGELRFHAPRAYQPHDGKQQDVASRYVITGNNRVGFLVPDYDRHQPLVIDPVLVYSTYLGGNSAYYGDYGNGITVDAAGNAYVIGGTSSANFPTTNAFQTAKGNTSVTAFVTKLGPGGSNLVYSTYIGGNNFDCGDGIAVDSAGNAYLDGWTLSTNFPTRNAFQSTIGGVTNIFVAKLGPAGSNLIYSTYLGGNGGYIGDWANAIAIDSAGNAYITGSVTSSNFPIRNAFQATIGSPSGNAFVAKFGPDGSNLVYSTYLGGNGTDYGYGIAVDTAGNACVAGHTSSTTFPTTNAFQNTLASPNGNAFVAKLGGPGGSNLIYSTYLGGSSYKKASAVAMDAAGNAYVTGYTSSTNFPTQNAFQKTLHGTVANAFVTKLGGPGGSNLVYSTYLGGSYYDYGYGIAVDNVGDAFATGFTFSTNFPTRNAFQKTLGGQANAFVTELDPSGSNLVYSSYLGGNGFDVGYGITVDAAGSAYVIGYTTSSTFPTTNAFQTALAGSNGNARHGLGVGNRQCSCHVDNRRRRKLRVADQHPAG